MKIFKKLIYTCAAVLTAVLSVGCSQSDNGDDPDMPDFEEGIPTEVRISLSAQAGNSQTRADGGTPKDPTSTVELIHDWWMVFIDKNGNIAKVIKSTDGNDIVTDRKQSTSVNVTGGGYEAETFRTIIPSGTYRVYAFANIPPDMTKFNAKYDKAKHQLVDTYINDFITNAFDGNTNSANNSMQWPDTKNIPMTQILKDLVIKNTVEELFNIEVVRAVAKVQFYFSNPSTDEITLKTLGMSPISNDRQISIVPNNEAIGIKANEKLITDGVTTGTLSFDLGSKKLTTDNQNHTLSFYCKESLPHDQKEYQENKEKYKDKTLLKNLYPKPFEIHLTFDKNGTPKEKTLYTKEITYINRNDWIYIPIKFNNWVIKWKLHYYPPIGGYPPVFNQDPDGTSLSATLTTGGEFELYPVEVLMNGTSYKVDMSNTTDKPIAVSVESGGGLFITPPTLMDNPNVSGHPLYGTDFPKIIAGELDPKKTGEAKVKITFYLKDSPGITEALDCTFTINRQNSAPSSGTGDDSSDD